MDPVKTLNEQSYENISEDLWKMIDFTMECAEFSPDNIAVDRTLRPVYNTGTDQEKEMFFYHPDHLGSSSFVSNIDGEAYQHLQYLPFGESFIDQRHDSPYFTPYTFSAKEKDEETDFSYFGARYYNSEVSVWLSVDPLAGKYPGTSSYMYCLGNPVMLIDPDGRYSKLGALWRSIVDGGGGKIEQLNNGEWGYQKGSGTTIATIEWHDGRFGGAGWRGKDPVTNTLKQGWDKIVQAKKTFDNKVHKWLQIFQPMDDRVENLNNQPVLTNDKVPSGDPMQQYQYDPFSGNTNPNLSNNLPYDAGNVTPSGNENNSGSSENGWILFKDVDTLEKRQLSNGQWEYRSKNGVIHGKSLCDPEYKDLNTNENIIQWKLQNGK